MKKIVLRSLGIISLLALLVLLVLVTINQEINIEPRKMAQEDYTFLSPCEGDECVKNNSIPIAMIALASFVILAVILLIVNKVRRNMEKTLDESLE